MKDISYHMLDIVQNSLNAGASAVEISIKEQAGLLTLVIKDNGSGMSEDLMNQVTDPFFTSSVTKKVGLGLPLLKQNAKLTGGSFHIASEKATGTTVTATFNTQHIDMIPYGDIAMSIRTLIACNPEKDFIYSHTKEREGFCMNTREIRDALDGISLKTPDVLDYIAQFINENMNALDIY